MNIHRIRIVAAVITFIISVSVITGCASTVIPSRTPENGTLVVLPVFILDTVLETYYRKVSFKLNFENTSTGKQYSIDVHNSSYDFVYAYHFPEGEYSIKDYEATAGVIGNKYRVDVNNTLVVKKGTAAVCSCKFSLITKSRGNGRATFYSYVTEIKQEQMKLIRDKLVTKKELTGWKL